MSDVHFEDNTAEVQDAMQTAVLRGLERIGSQAEGYAKDLCPVNTGLLRNSITHALSGEAPAITTYKADKGGKSGSYSGTAPDEGAPSVYIGTNVEYAEPVEVGTSKMAAQPYLKPSAADHGKTYQNIMEDELKNG